MCLSYYLHVYPRARRVPGRPLGRGREYQEAEGAQHRGPGLGGEGSREKRGSRGQRDVGGLPEGEFELRLGGRSPGRNRAPLSDRGTSGNKGSMFRDREARVAAEK